MVVITVSKSNSNLYESILYLSGLSTTDIGKITGKSSSGIAYRLGKFGITRPKNIAQNMPLAKHKSKGRVAHNKLDIEGMTFGYLKALSQSGVKHYGKDKEPRSIWSCKCLSCGNIDTYIGSELTQGKVSHCGCMKEYPNKTHGDSNSKYYFAWQSMISRCKNPNHMSYKNYGARGIDVCERWLKYENFKEDMGDRPEGMSLDRIDNDGNYEPSNCKWSTRTEQCRNKRTNRNITLRGMTKTLSGWAEELGLEQSSLSERLEKWDFNKAMTTHNLRG
jgi:hypothetical protein